jgi:hypothetical protein
VSDPRDLAAEQLEALAAELERAAAHCRVAANHYRDREIPRASAHSWAAYGHLTHVQQGLHSLAQHHADKSSV